MACSSTQPRPKRSCSALGSSVRTFQLQAELTLWCHFVNVSSCWVLRLIRPSPCMIAMSQRSSAAVHTTRHIRPLLTLEAAKRASHGIVTARLDYCHALLHGTSVRNLNRLQVAQNKLARTVCRTARSVSATELRRQLHWPPVRQRINHKLALLTYKTRSTGTTAYLASLL